MNYSRAKTISVADILDNYGEWGIPHFQRGGVWGADNVSRLLESLYHGTPCGSIILWKQHRSEFGIPLVGSADKSFKHLIIDGQQRTRSLIAAFDGGSVDESDDGGSDSAEENGSAEDDSSAPASDLRDEATLKKYWSVNLERIPEFMDILNPDAKAFQAPMFVLVEDVCDWNKWLARRREKASETGVRQSFVFNKPYLKRSVPLKFFFGPGDFADQLDVDLVEVIKERLKTTGDFDASTGQLSERAMKAIRSLSGRIRQMKRREFFLSILKTSSLSEVIDVFIRINSGGRPVEEEERAYSQLLRVYAGNRHKGKSSDEPTSADGWIDSIFKWVHGSPSGGDTHQSLASRDQVLARANERALGFKFFLRTFILAASYHSSTGVSRKAFSFNVLYEPVFLKSISAGGDSKVWSRTRDIVRAIAELIRTDLCLDSFRFLPGARVLWPVMMLLIRFSGIMERRGTPMVAVLPEYRGALAYIILKLTLSNPTDRWLLDRVVEMAAVRTSARDAVDDLIRVLELPRFESAMDETLREANSLQSMPVLMMYGLERSRAARDFLYGKYGFATAEMFNRSERMIDHGSQPEKQHIVPYSLLTAAYGLESMGRISSHQINNIGNITYLSHAMNGLDGLGQTLLNFDGEPETNLAAHCLSPESLELYRQVCELLKQIEAGSDVRAALKVKFEEWTKSRRADIKEAFLSWLLELKSVWLESRVRMFDSLARIEPESPVLTNDLQSLGLEYLIRQLDLDNRIEDKLIEVFADTGWYCDKRDSGGLELSWKNGGKSWISGVRLDKQGLALEIGGIPHGVSFEAGHDAETFAKAFGDVVTVIQGVQQEARNRSAEKRASARKRKSAESQSKTTS